jgi:hypothetical protein
MRPMKKERKMKIEEVLKKDDKANEEGKEEKLLKL